MRERERERERDRDPLKSCYNDFVIISVIIAGEIYRPVGVRLAEMMMVGRLVGYENKREEPTICPFSDVRPGPVSLLIPLTYGWLSNSPMEGELSVRTMAFAADAR